jgi:hypothetical protein
MSIAPLDPPSAPEAAQTEAFHRAIVADRKIDPGVRLKSIVWLRENGFEKEPEESSSNGRGRRGKSGTGAEPGATIPMAPHAIDLKRGPQNLAAEFTLISKIIADPMILSGLVERLDPENFAGYAHRLILTTVLDRHGRGLSFDAVTLGSELGRNILFLEAGGSAVLTRTMEVDTRGCDPEELLSSINSTAVRRRLISAAREMERAAIEAENPEDELMALARGRLDSVVKDSLATSWERPLLNDEEVPAPFPVDVLPDGLKEFVESAAKTVFFPPEYLAVPCLTIAGAGIGRSLAIRINASWIEHACLFTLIVGNPGTGKSAAIVKLSPGPIVQVARELRSDYRIKRMEWEAAKRAFLTENKGSKLGIGFDEIAPRPRRIDVEDITRERLAEALSENPRGMVMIHDELSDWLDGMNQYKSGGGNDRNIFLKIWSGSRITIDRKSQEDGMPIIVPSPFLAISGGIQPDILPKLSNDGMKDGFIDRFLFSYPDEREMGWSWDSIPTPAIEGWNVAFRRLWERKPNFAIDDDPVIVPFANKAMQRYAAWFEQECRECYDDEFELHFRGPWVKYRAYAARLALILEQLHWAYDPKSNGKLRPVGLEALEGALALIEYFKSHYRRVHAKIHGGRRAENALAKDIASWCTKSRRQKFRESEVRDNFRRRLVSNPSELETALRWLVQRRCIRKTPSAPKTSGRQPCAVYEVNPLLFSETRAPIAPNSEPNVPQ